MNIAITGANGFLGKNLYKRLFGLFHIEKITRHTPEREMFRILENAQIVFHLAGICDDPSKTHIDFYNSNVRLTQDVCNVLISSQNLVPIIYPSTLDIDNEDSLFSLSKRDAENTLSSYGLSIVYRLPLMVGKYCNNQHSIVSQIFSNILCNKQTTINNQLIKLMFVDDLTNLFSSITTGITEFSIVEPQPVYTIETNELIQTIQQIHDGYQTDNTNELSKNLYKTYLNLLNK